MSGHLPDKIKQERADIIKEISKNKFEEFMKKNINTVQTVLIEKRPDKHTGFLKGVTPNYINVLINNNSQEYYNTLHQVKLLNFENDKFYGELTD